MNFLDLAKSRFSVRKYSDQKVEKEKLDKILEAAHVAPSAANFQPVRLVVAQEKESLQMLSSAARIFNAPLAIIICSDHSKAWTRPSDGKQTVDIDASIVTDHMMLEATDLGLGSVWVGYFDICKIRNFFQIPDNYEPISILLLGYSLEDPRPANRHSNQRIPIETLVSYETFG